jgi:hypothetical protein
MEVLMGKSSINKWAIFHGKVLNNQMVYAKVPTEVGFL